MMASANLTANTMFYLMNGGIGIPFFIIVLVILLLMIFVYKTYKTTYQRLILYYVILGLWVEFVYCLQILEAFSQKRWVCIAVKYLRLSSVIAWYTWITVITNFSLLLIPCLMRGIPMYRSRFRCVECISVPITLIIASVQAVSLFVKHAQVENDVGCLRTTSNPAELRRNLIYQSICLCVNLEVVLVSLFLSIFFHFIRRRLPSRQTALSLLLKNLIYHFGINAFAMAMYCISIAYNIYADSIVDDNTITAAVSIVERELVDSSSRMVISVFVIIQGLFCICTSTQRCICCRSCNQHQQYEVIGGNNTATNPASTRISQPSYTNFAVPYTGGFTQITREINTDGAGETQ